VVKSNIRAVHFYESEEWRVRREFSHENPGIRWLQSTSRSGIFGALILRLNPKLSGWSALRQLHLELAKLAAQCPSGPLCRRNPEAFSSMSRQSAAIKSQKAKSSRKRRLRLISS
jgi:hypothetical protein